MNDVAAVIALLIGFMIGGIVAHGVTKSHYRAAAVDLGYAAYSVDNRGDISWAWKAPEKENQ